MRILIRADVAFLSANAEYKDDPEKVQEPIEADSIGLGQYARYRVVLSKMDGEGKPEEEKTRMGTAWADENQKLMCKERALTSPHINEMFFTLTDPRARADQIAPWLKAGDYLIDGGGFLSKGAAVFKVPILLTWLFFVKGVRRAIPTVQQTLDKIRSRLMPLKNSRDSRFEH
jgi:hypothetical protein